jgi:hypothetical protein
MADAHGSGPCVRKDVGVQLPPCPLSWDADTSVSASCFFGVWVVGGGLPGTFGHGGSRRVRGLAVSACQLRSAPVWGGRTGREWLRSVRAGQLCQAGVLARSPSAPSNGCAARSSPARTRTARTARSPPTSAFRHTRSTAATSPNCYRLPTSPTTGPSATDGTGSANRAATWASVQRSSRQSTSPWRVHRSLVASVERETAAKMGE